MNSNPCFQCRWFSLKLRNMDATGMRANSMPGTNPVTKKYNGANARQDEAPLRRTRRQAKRSAILSTVSRHARISRTARVSERIICTSVSDIVIRWMSGPGCAVRFSQAISLLRFTIAEIAIRDIIHRPEQQRESEDRQHDGHVPDIGFAMHFPL